MDKLKFIGFVIFGVMVAYLFLSILMPLFVTVTGDAATEVLSSPNAGTYVGTVEGIRYTPLFLYMVPAVAGITAIVFKLRFAK